MITNTGNLMFDRQVSRWYDITNWDNDGKPESTRYRWRSTIHKAPDDQVYEAQAALCDDLATDDVRLSVLLAATDTTSGCSVPSAPAPSVWFMQPVEPNLTQRMRNELSPSPTMGITP